MANFDIYSLPHNDVDAALSFAEQHWCELRPEDFTTLARLNEAHSAELFQGLADLKRRKGDDGGERHGTVTHRRRRLRRLRYRSVLYVAAGKKPQLSKWVRMIRKRDGRIVQVRRGKETDKSKYKPLKPGTPAAKPTKSTKPLVKFKSKPVAKPVKKPAPSKPSTRTVKQKLVERQQRRKQEHKRLKTKPVAPPTPSKVAPPPPTERPPVAIGKTKSGKSIYAPSETLNHAHQHRLKGKGTRAERDRANDLLDDHFDHYEGMSAQDHRDAAKLHRHHAQKLERQWRKLVGRKGKPPKDKREEANALGQQLHAHQELARKHKIHEHWVTPAKPAKPPKGKSRPTRPEDDEGEGSSRLERVPPGTAHGRSWLEKPVYHEVPKKPPAAPLPTDTAPVAPKPRKIQVVVTDEAGKEHLVDMSGETPTPPVTPEKPARPEKPPAKPKAPSSKAPPKPKSETPKPEAPAPQAPERPTPPAPPTPPAAPPPPPKPAPAPHPHTPVTPPKKKVKIIVTDPDGTEREIDPDADDESTPEAKAASVRFFRRVPYVRVRPRRRSVK